MPWNKLLSPALGVPVWTAVLTVALLAYQNKFGSNVPVADEWDIAPQLRQSVDRGEVLGWLALRHNEHYYPLSRAVYAAVMVASGYDFHSGMVASVLALGGAAWLFASAARRRRGYAVWADLLLPALVLNWGAGDNVTMGYQLAFTLEVLSSAFAVWVVVADRGGRRWDAAAAFALVVLALNGVAGLLAAAPLLGWVLYRASRSPSPRWWKLAAAYLPAAAVVSYGVWAIVGGDRAAGLPSAIDSPSQFLSVAGQFLAVGLGTFVITEDWRGPAAVALTVYVAAAAVLARDFATRPADRAVAVGLAAVLLGVLGMAAGVAAVRGGGLVERYATLSAVGLATAWVSLSRGLPSSALVNGAGVVAAVVLFVVNVLPGDHFGQVRQMYCRVLEGSVREGLPPSCVADRFRGPLFDQDHFRGRLELLRDLGFTTFKDMQPEPVAVAVVGERPAAGVIEAPLALPTPADRRKVFAVRVSYAVADDVAWQQLTLTWTGTGGVPKRSSVYPSRRRGPQSSTFYVNDAVAAAHLAVGRPEAHLSVVGVEWLYAVDPAERVTPSSPPAR